MRDYDWERVQEIFGQVVDLPRDQQQAAVAEMSADDPDLEQEVLELLDEDAAERGLLDVDIGVVASNALQSDVVRSLVQHQIGPYQLRRLIGEGGMGVVYLAERTDIGGLVAIKFLRDAWISKSRRERFLNEQRILARLDHRAIAHINDAGTLQDGTPWYVMEYVEGWPITEYLQRHSPSVAEKLRLFRLICDAVQHAHGLAIIHRDLKPSNIFVSRAGEVKLLDFGIAKILDSQGEDAKQTIAGLRFLSPAYAAPEQHSGGTVGVFTDIYALGVLLYEMLTGTLPTGADSREESRPAKPSLIARVSSRGPGQELERYQWADLDMICLTAMQRDPELRYRSVDALARDIEAYLENRPLQSRPPAMLYTAGKFVRRNRVPLVAMASALFLFAAIAIIFTMRLASARNAASAEAVRVNHILEFTEELFDGGDPGAGPDMNLKVMDVLDRGKQEALSLSSDPGLRARLMIMLGSAYGKLGQIGTANQLLQIATGDLKGRADQQTDYVDSLAALADLRKQERKLPEAQQLLETAIAATPGPLRQNGVAEHLHADLGSVLALRGQYPQADRELQTALSLHPASSAANAQLADDLTQLAEVNYYLGRYDAAEALNQRALQMNTLLHGRNHPSVAENLNNLAAIAGSRGDHAKEESILREALSITQNWYGPGHPLTADALTALSGSLIARGKMVEADEAVRRALAIQIQTYGEQHSSVALTYNQLGLIASTRDQATAAEKYFRAALEIWQKLYGPDHQFVGLAYSNLASVYMHRKEYPKAEEVCRQALRVFASGLPGENLNSAVAHIRLGRILMREERLREAESETLTGYRYFAAQGLASNNYLQAARKDLAQIELGLGRPDLVARYSAAASGP